MFAWNVEIVVLVDDVRAITVVGSAQGAAVSKHLSSGAWETAVRFARESGFPGHGLVVRPDTSDDGRIIKDIHSWETYEEVFSRTKALSSNATVFIEVDLRAHANPTRMELIKRAAEDLAPAALALPILRGTRLLAGRAPRRASLRGVRAPHRRDGVRSVGLPKMRFTRNSREEPRMPGRSRPVRSLQSLTRAALRSAVLSVPEHTAPHAGSPAY